MAAKPKPRAGAAAVGVLVAVAAAVVAWKVWFALYHSDESMAWSLAAVDDRTAVLQITHGACDDFARFDVTETATSVTIAAVYRVRNTGCDDIALLECRAVMLEAPLGSRTLLHAPLHGGPPAATPDPGPRAGLAEVCASDPLAGDGHAGAVSDER